LCLFDSEQELFFEDRIGWCFHRERIEIESRDRDRAEARERISFIEMIEKNYTYPFRRFMGLLCQLLVCRDRSQSHQFVGACLCNWQLVW
jgi:hypothetical protein